MGTEASRPGSQYVIISGAIQPVEAQEFIKEEESVAALASDPANEESAGLLGYVIISGAIQPVSVLGAPSQVEEASGTPAGDEENRSALS